MPARAREATRCNMQQPTLPTAVSAVFSYQQQRRIEQQHRRIFAYYPTLTALDYSSDEAIDAGAAEEREEHHEAIDASV